MDTTLERVGELVVVLGGIAMSLIFLSIAGIARHRATTRVMAWLVAICLLFQGGCCMMIVSFNSSLGGSGGGVMLPLSLVGAILVIMLTTRLLSRDK